MRVPLGAFEGAFECVFEGVHERGVPLRVPLRVPFGVPLRVLTGAGAATAIIAKVVDENRWAISHEVFGLKSRSWVVYGERLALRKCQSWAWACHEALGRGECPYADIKATPWESWRRSKEAAPVAPQDG